MSTIRRLCEAHGKRKDRCKECGGSAFCEHGKQKQRCKECKGVSICEHGKQKAACKKCKGSSICEHENYRTQCKECKGSSICEHGKQRSQCKECKGSSICEHDKQRGSCKVCKGCEHNRFMRYCRECATEMGDKFPYPLEELPVRNIDRKPKEEEPVQKRARQASPTGAEIAASSLAQLIYEGEVSEEEALGNENILLLPDVGANLGLDSGDWARRWS